MKKYTKKFLDRKLLGELSRDNIDSNAKGGFKELYIPVELWKEISKEFSESILRIECANSNTPTTFMAGFIIGWAEKNKLIN